MTKNNNEIIKVMGKECKLIPETDNQYAVSKDGCVYSLMVHSGWYKTARERFFNEHPDYNEEESGIFGKLMNQYKVNSNYLVVHLKTEDRFKMYYVHRLVAEAFVDNNDPIHNTDVNHIDENKLNNNVSNLEFRTRKENVNHGNAQKVHRSRKGIKHNGTYPVALYRNNELVKVFKNIADAARWISPEKWNSKKAQLGYILTSTTKTKGFKTVGGFTPKLISYNELIDTISLYPNKSGIKINEFNAIVEAGEKNYNSIVKKLASHSINVSKSGLFAVDNKGVAHRVKDMFPSENNEINIEYETKLF